jgi:hypothetical protein
LPPPRGARLRLRQRWLPAVPEPAGPQRPPRAAPQLRGTEPSLLGPQLSPRPRAFRWNIPIHADGLARRPDAAPTFTRGNRGTFTHSELRATSPAARVSQPGWAPQTPWPPCGPRPSPCSGAPSGGSSSSDLRCWGLACLRRDMLLAALGTRAGQRHQRGGRRGRRGAGAGRPGGRGARGAGRRRRRLRGPRMGLSN